MEKEKFHFTYTLPCKIICFLLFAALAVAVCAGGLTCVLGIEEGWFDNDSRGFYDSGILHGELWSNYYDIMDAYLNDNEPYIESENLLYVLYDEDGRALMQNCDGERAVFIDSIGLDHWVQTGDGEWEEQDFTVSFYLRSPMVRDGLYFTCAAYNWAMQNRGAVLVLTLISFAAAIVCLVFLVCGAGRKNGSEQVCLAWINRRFPLDLHLVLALAVGVLLGAGFLIALDDVSLDSAVSLNTLRLVFAALCTAAFAALCAHVIVCFSARAKAGAWWRNTICYKVIRWCWRLVKKFFRAVKSVFNSLPLVWKSLVVFCAAAFLNIVLAVFMLSSGLAFFLLFVLDCALLVGVGYVALQMRRLQQGAQELAKGNIDFKTDTNGMFWEFKKHAENLNSVSEGMSRAVEERMKSERFKTELITNVSHDIKTPLTSIISYVDLLKKEDIENEKAQEYIEVIDRQSARLKKLTEDLVEASKASSGAIKLDMERVDVSEMLRQSAGEYSDRLAQAGLKLVLSVPDRALPIMADGRQVWRIFENLLSNIRKYALPGTRAYISAEGVHGGVFVTFRNISANELNITPAELMERFVRGDSSRSTEGSGLGLSIARSLAELMGGNFEIFLDGDLFKAVVSFPMLYEGESM